MSFVPSNWWQEEYDDRYFQLYSLIIPQEKTKLEVDFLCRILKWPPGSKILDLGCGWGRHSIELAKRGFKVTGLDQSTKLLARAREIADKENVKVELVQEDMREIPYQNQFQAVLSLLNTFGFFPEPKDDFRVLEGVRKALQKDGKYVLELRNPLRLREGGIYSPEEVLPGGKKIKTKQSFDQSRSMTEIKRSLFSPNGQKILTHIFYLRIYEPKDLTDLLKKSGLEETARFGDIDGSSFTESSPRLIILSQKI